VVVTVETVVLLAVVSVTVVSVTVVRDIVVVVFGGGPSVTVDAETVVAVAVVVVLVVGHVPQSSLQLFAIESTKLQRDATPDAAHSEASGTPSHVGGPGIVVVVAVAVVAVVVTVRVLVVTGGAAVVLLQLWHLTGHSRLICPPTMGLSQSASSSAQSNPESASPLHNVGLGVTVLTLVVEAVVVVTVVLVLVTEVAEIDVPVSVVELVVGHVSHMIGQVVMTTSRSAARVDVQNSTV
jgi:hypothetical protein